MKELLERKIGEKANQNPITALYQIVK